MKKHMNIIVLLSVIATVAIIIGAFVYWKASNSSMLDRYVVETSTNPMDTKYATYLATAYAESVNKDFSEYTQLEDGGFIGSVGAGIIEFDPDSNSLIVWGIISTFGDSFEKRPAYLEEIKKIAKERPELTSGGEIELKKFPDFLYGVKASGQPWLTLKKTFTVKDVTASEFINSIDNITDLAHYSWRKPVLEAIRNVNSTQGLPYWSPNFKSENTLEDFIEKLEPKMSMEEVEKIFGEPDQDIGNVSPAYLYEIDEGKIIIRSDALGESIDSAAYIPSDAEHVEDYETKELMEEQYKRVSGLIYNGEKTVTIGMYKWFELDLIPQFLDLTEMSAEEVGAIIGVNFQEDEEAAQEYFTIFKGIDVRPNDIITGAELRIDNRNPKKKLLSVEIDTHEIKSHDIEKRYFEIDKISSPEAPPERRISYQLESEYFRATMTFHEEDYLTGLFLDTNEVVSFLESENEYVIFSEDEGYYGRIADKKRFTPTADEVELAQKVLKTYLYYQKDQIRDIEEYKFQFLGYMNESGEKIIWANAFCNGPENWKDGVINVLDGGNCFFNAEINLDTEEVSRFMVNGQA